MSDTPIDFSFLLKDILSSSNLRDLERSLSQFNSTGFAAYKVDISLPTGQITMLKQSEFYKQHWNPKSYQKRAIRLLLSQASAGLFLDPGMGKTSTVLATLKILKTKGLFTRALIVAPLRAIYNTWPDEIEKWEDFSELSYTIVHGARKAYNLTLAADIHLVNPEGLSWLLANTKLEYDVLVIDESNKFKNSQTQRFKTLKPFLSGFKRRWILTGTPAPNGLEDLFGQIYILDLGRALGRFITHFRREFFHLGGFNLYDWRPNPDAWEKVTERISPLILQMDAEDHLQMPSLLPITIPVSLPQSAMNFYNSLDNEFIASWNDVEFVGGTAAVVGGKLRQLANGALYNEDRTWTVFHEEKLDALENLLEEIGSKPVLILYEFNHDRDRILARVPGTEILGGGTSPGKEKEIIARFNAGSLTRLAGHPKSMGVSLNLQQSCCHIVWFGIPWDLYDYIQATDRVYRQGQKSSTVFVYHIVAKNTKDEEVMKVLESKDRTQEALERALRRHRQEHYGED